MERKTETGVPNEVNLVDEEDSVVRGEVFGKQTERKNLERDYEEESFEKKEKKRTKEVLQNLMCYCE